nr:SH3 domain-containing protein [Anaerolineae bacterium]
MLFNLTITRNHLRFLLIGCLLVLLVLPLSAAHAEAPVQQSDLVARARDHLRIRSGPGTEHPQIGLIPFSATADVLGRNEAADWIFIEYEGTRGWVAAWLCWIYGDVWMAPVTDAAGSTPTPEPVPPPASRPPQNTDVRVATDYNLRIRSAPTTDSTSLGQVFHGTELPVLGRNEAASWVLIEHDGVRGWIAAWYTTIYGNLYDAPVSDAIGGPVAPASPPTTQPAPTQEGRPADTGIIATAQANLRVRSGPGAGYGQVGAVPFGETMRALGRFDGEIGTWLYIDHNGLLGWVAGWYTILSRSVFNLPYVGTDLPVGSPGQPAGANPEPPAGAYVMPSVYSATITNVGTHLHEIFRRGLQNGNQPNRFMKVGDSESVSVLFMRRFDDGPDFYDLGAYGYLQEVIDYFDGSFNRINQTLVVGLSASQMMDPLWANPEYCLPGENILECEYRLFKPSFAIMMMRSYDAYVGPGSSYYYNLRAGVVYLLDQGVIPILSTVHLWDAEHQPTDPMNESIRAIATEFNVPLWDWHATAETLPGRGVDAVERTHLTRPPLPDWNANRLTEENLQYGVVRRNLEALEALHAMLTFVVKPVLGQ